MGKQWREMEERDFIIIQRYLGGFFKGDNILEKSITLKYPKYDLPINIIFKYII